METSLVDRIEDSVLSRVENLNSSVGTYLSKMATTLGEYEDLTPQQQSEMKIDLSLLRTNVSEYNDVRVV